MAFRVGGGGGDRQPNRHSDRYQRPKRPFYDSDDFDKYYVSDRDSLPPEAKRSRPMPYDYNAEVPFLVEPRPSRSPDAFAELEFSGPTPPPIIQRKQQYTRHWAPNSRCSPDPDTRADIVESFLVRRGDDPPRPFPPPPEVGMERTESGLAIGSEIVERCASTELLKDDEAANRVREHMARRRKPDSKHERILRSIINPRSMAAEYRLDDASLQSIFSAVNEIFFNGRLSQRVTWDWSHQSSSQYTREVVGTTALRLASRRRGFETLIVLSSPILRDQTYSRRLLISTFIHELIHSYLFICCGFHAGDCGGHTHGFRTIAKLIDDWAGPDSQLYLSKMEADLERFRLGRRRSTSPSDRTSHSHSNVIYSCSGFDEHNRAIFEHGPDHHNQNVPWWGHPRPVRPLHPGPGPGDDQGSQYVYAADVDMLLSRTPPASRVTPRF